MFELVPIVVGVTGHRDIPAQAEEPLRASFGELLSRLNAEYPNTPLAVLSPLAAGSDTIAAEEALLRGVPVIAVLPMPAAEYESDFDTAQLERFRAVLARCDDCIIAGDAADRERAYVLAGAFIAYYSALVVAFWDGESARGNGGTAHVVAMREGLQLPPEMLVPYIPDVGPVFQIVTPRIEGSPNVLDYTVVEHYPLRVGMVESGKHHLRWRFEATESAAQEEFHTAMEQLERFNCDLSDEPVPAGAEGIEAFQLRAGEAAQKLQRWTMISLHTVYAVAAVAGTVQLVVAPPVEFSWATAIRLALLAAAFGGFRFAKRKDYENRYQDYRAIAEALRVQQAWCTAGLRDHLVESAYRQMQQSELQWIRLALRTIYLVSGGRTARRTDAPHAQACNEWIESQIDYYARNGVRQERKQHLATVAMSVLGAIALVCTAAALILSALALPGSRDILQYAVTVPAAVCGWIAILLRFYTQQRGYVENARRYAHMFEVFCTARAMLNHPHGDAESVLAKVGYEALSEHADWLILHRERPLHFVSG